MTVGDLFARRLLVMSIMAPISVLAVLTRFHISSKTYTAAAAAPQPGAAALGSAIADSAQFARLKVGNEFPVCSLRLAVV